VCICESTRQPIDEKEFWSRRYKRPISDEELRQIREYVTTFFKILEKWDGTCPVITEAENLQTQIERR